LSRKSVGPDSFRTYDHMVHQVASQNARCRT
jgi:hypothetical protein